MAFFHCIYGIEQKNMWFDEVYSWNLSLETPKDIVKIASGDIHPPLFYITLKAWTNLVSDSVVAMRMLSTLLIMGGMFFLYKICRLIKITDKRIIAILILYAVSPVIIYYAQEVRMQGLNLFLTMGSAYFFLKFLYGKKNIYGAFWALCAMLSIYTHYFALLVLFSQLIIIAVKYYEKEIDFSFARKMFFFFLIPCICFLPWLPTFLQQVQQGQPWRVSLSLPQIFDNYLTYFREIFFSHYWNYENKGFIMGATYFSLALILGLISGSVVYILKSDKKKLPIIILFFVPSVIAILISFRQSIIFSRYLLIIVPYLYILCVFIVFRTKKRYISYPVTLILILASSYGLTIYYNNNYKNNDYRKIEAFITEHYTAEDKIIVDPHYLGWIIKYDNLHGKTTLPAPEILGWNLGMQVDSLSKRSDLSKVWIVLDYASMDKNDYDSLNTKMNSLGFKHDSLKNKTFYLYPDKVRTAYYYK